MNNKKYKISYNGECVNDKDVQIVKQNLAKLLKLDLNKVETFFNGNSIDLKSNINYETAEKYRKAFEKVGAICKVEPIEEKLINNLLVENLASNLQEVTNEESQEDSVSSKQEFFSFHRYLLSKEKFKQEWKKIYWLIIFLSVGLITLLTVIFQQRQEISSLESRISILENEVFTLTYEKENLKNELDECRSKKDEYEGILSEQSSSNSSLKDDNDDMEIRIISLESNNNNLESKINDLESELSSCQRNSSN